MLAGATWNGKPWGAPGAGVPACTVVIDVFGALPVTIVML